MFFFGEKTWEKTFSIVCVLQKYFYIIASFYTFVTHQLKFIYFSLFIFDVWIFKKNTCKILISLILLEKIGSEVV